jgi:hypothetical protein
MPYEYIVAAGNFKVVSKNTNLLTQREKTIASIFVKQHKDKISFKNIASESLYGLDIREAFLKLQQLCNNR